MQGRGASMLFNDHSQCVANVTVTRWVRVFFSFLVLTGWATHPGLAHGATPSIQVINEAAPGSSGQVALGTTTSFTTAIANIANTKRDWKLEGAGTLTFGGGIDGWALYTPPDSDACEPHRHSHRFTWRPTTR